MLLAHVRCKRKLDRLLGCPPINQQIQQVDERLWAVNMTPEASIREIGMMVLRFRSVYRAVMENRLVKYFIKAIPALAEYSMLGKTWYHTTETLGDRPKYDTVILDGPATGHLISMLRIPQVILDIVPHGPLTRDAAAAQQLLADPRATQMWIVTLAEEMPVAEAIDLYQAARYDLGIAVDRLIVNMVYPNLLMTPESRSAFDTLRSADELPLGLQPFVEDLDVIATRRAVNEHYLGRLAEKIPLPRVELPHLFTERIDRTKLENLVAPLGASLKATSNG